MFQGKDAELSARLRLFAEQTRDFVGMADGWGRVVYLNPAARKRLGIAEAAELSIADVFPVEEFAVYYEMARPQLLRTGEWSGQIRVNVAGEGAVPMYVSTSATVGPGGEINALVIHAREVPPARPGDVTDGLEIDEVTGLLARPGFEHVVRLALAEAERADEGCGLVLVGIAGMSGTIDAFGEVAAVRVVRSLAGRMTRFARTIDVVGRVGEYRLALLLRHVGSHGEALRVAEMVRETLIDPPVTTAGGEVAVFVGCGVAFSRPGDDADSLLRRAADALTYESERDGEVEVAFADVEGAEPAPTMAEFRIAFPNRELRAYVQPVVDLRSDRVVAYRGLARWEHPRLGMLHAAAFVDMIAATPLANQVDLYVARETAGVVAVAARDDPLSLYLPVSRRLLTDVYTELYLSEIADAYVLSLNQMRLLIARRLLEDRSPPLRDAVVSLADAGFPLVLTGVETASDLDDLPAGFREVHLARRLTSLITSEPTAQLELLEIVDRSHDRGWSVAAAGVDTAEQREALLGAGADLAYGDLYAAPELAEDIE